MATAQLIVLASLACAIRDSNDIIFLFCDHQERFLFQHGISFVFILSNICFAC